MRGLLTEPLEPLHLPSHRLKAPPFRSVRFEKWLPARPKKEPPRVFAPAVLDAKDRAAILELIASRAQQGGDVTATDETLMHDTTLQADGTVFVRTYTTVHNSVGQFVFVNRAFTQCARAKPTAGSIRPADLLFNRSMIGSQVSIVGASVFIAVSAATRWQRHEVAWVASSGATQREDTKIVVVEEKAGGKVALSNGASFRNETKPAWVVIGERQDANCRQRAEDCYHRQFGTSRTLVALDELDPYPGLAISNAVKKVDGKSATEIQKFLQDLDADGELDAPVDYAKQVAEDDDMASSIQHAIKAQLTTH